MKVEVISSKVIKGYRRIKTAIMSTANVYCLNPIGFDSVPLKNTRLVKKTLNRQTVSIGGIQKAIDDLKEGEVCIFSKDSKGGISATIRHRNDGSLELNGDGDYAVKYTELKKSFDELQLQFNTLVTTFNAHVHPIPFAQALSAVTTPSSSPTVTPGSPSIANISTSKAPTVKLP